MASAQRAGIAAVLGLETTCFSPRRDEIVEFALMLPRNDRFTGQAEDRGSRFHSAA